MSFMAPGRLLNMCAVRIMHFRMPQYQSNPSSLWKIITVFNTVIRRRLILMFAKEIYLADRIMDRFMRRNFGKGNAAKNPLVDPDRKRTRISLLNPTTPNRIWRPKDRSLSRASTALAFATPAREDAPGTINVINLFMIALKGPELVQLNDY